jgi:hypothetical protein
MSSSNEINITKQVTSDQEQIPELDEISDNSDTAAARQVVQKDGKKNFLCKNLFEQCKELCYN